MAVAKEKMKTAIRFISFLTLALALVLFLFISGLALAGCKDSATSQHSDQNRELAKAKIIKHDHPEGERMVEGVVGSAWESGETRYVRIRVNNEDFQTSDEMVFWDKHFKEMNPQINDCVKVWVYDYHYSDGREDLTIILDRNITPCEK